MIEGGRGAQRGLMADWILAELSEVLSERGVREQSSWRPRERSSSAKSPAAASTWNLVIAREGSRPHAVGQPARSVYRACYATARTAHTASRWLTSWATSTGAVRASWTTAGRFRGQALAAVRPRRARTMADRGGLGSGGRWSSRRTFVWHFGSWAETCWAEACWAAHAWSHHIEPAP
jgi:hypothetical protein